MKTGGIVNISDLVDLQDEFKYVDITYSQDNFKEQFTEHERTYRVSSENKYFDSSMIGTSMYGNCLDGSDNGVRLDLYKWRIEKIHVEWW